LPAFSHACAAWKRQVGADFALLIQDPWSILGTLEVHPVPAHAGAHQRIHIRQGLQRGRSDSHSSAGARAWAGRANWNNPCALLVQAHAYLLPLLGGELGCGGAGKKVKRLAKLCLVGESERGGQGTGADHAWFGGQGTEV